MLLSVIGNKTYSLLRSLVAPESLADKDFDVLYLVTALKGYFEPKSKKGYFEPKSLKGYFEPKSI